MLFCPALLNYPFLHTYLPSTFVSLSCFTLASFFFYLHFSLSIAIKFFPRSFLPLLCFLLLFCPAVQFLPTLLPFCLPFSPPLSRSVKLSFPTLYELLPFFLFIFSSHSTQFLSFHSSHSILQALPYLILPHPTLPHSTQPRPLLTFSANGDKLDSLAGDEVESFVNVGNLVEPHLATVWLRESLAGDDLMGTREHEEHRKTVRGPKNTKSARNDL